MTPERFQHLLQAYGADIRRWPQADQSGAQALLAEGMPERLAELAEARALDGWLDSHAVAAPSEALTQRVLAGAPEARRAGARQGPQRGWTGAWWAGAGLFGVGLAGSLAGVMVASLVMRNAAPAAADWPERGTAFNAVPADWSEE